MGEAMEAMRVDPGAAFAALEELIACGPKNTEEVRLNTAAWLAGR